MKQLAVGLAYLRSLSRRFFESDRAQDTFEYIIIIGVVIVAVVFAAFTGVGQTLINFVVSQTQGSVSDLYSSVPPGP